MPLVAAGGRAALAVAAVVALAACGMQGERGAPSTDTAQPDAGTAAVPGIPPDSATASDSTAKSDTTAGSDTVSPPRPPGS